MTIISKLTTFEQAQKLCAIGFNRLVDKSYNVSTGEIISHVHVNANALDGAFYSAHTVSDALDWVREDKGIVCYVDVIYHPLRKKAMYIGKILSESGLIIQKKTEEFDTHPLASSALLDAVLYYLEQKEQKIV